MITDERLKEYADKKKDLSKKELRSVCLELLSLREQKRKLVEDGIRLATSLRNIKLMFVRIEVESDKKYVKQMDDALDQHNALMKEVE